MIRFTLILTAVVICIAAVGCTDAERRGYSSIPHSTPASWEIAPYGDMRN
ncbi:MAG: hypothetical protein IJZ19_01340 [Lentisphaeria bacterium]|nr:hypothetical protein [Lentisphaeria bacterium]MBQ9775874.1 hypothetical protein [Lentisphaeria bacterium]